MQVLDYQIDKINGKIAKLQESRQYLESEKQELVQLDDRCKKG